MHKILKPIILGVFIIIVIELFLRVNYREELKTRIYPLIYQPDSLIDYKFIPNTHTKFSGAGFSLKDVYINSKGYSFKEFKTKKKPGVYRIAIVGSSLSGNIYMNGNEAYSDKVQRLFNANNYNVEVINCSIDGSGRQRANLDLINRDILQFNPDLIVLEFDLPFMSKNLSRMIYKDYVIEYEPKSDRSKNFGKEIVDYWDNHPCLTFFYDISYIVRLMCKYYLENSENDLQKRRIEAYKTKVVRADPIAFDKAYVCYTIKSTMKLLKQTRDNIIKNDSKLLLFHPSINLNGNNPLNKELMDSLNKNFDCLFLGLDFKQTHRSLPDGHLNEKGHELIATTFYLKVKKYIH